MIFQWSWTHIGLGHSLLGIYLQHFPSLLFCFRTKEADLGCLFCQLCIVVVACLMCQVSVHVCVCVHVWYCCAEVSVEVCFCVACCLWVLMSSVHEEYMLFILHSTLLKNCCAIVKFAYVGMFLSFLWSLFWFVVVVWMLCNVCWVMWMHTCESVWMCVCVCVPQFCLTLFVCFSVSGNGFGDDTDKRVMDNSGSMMDNSGSIGGCGSPKDCPPCQGVASQELQFEWALTVKTRRVHDPFCCGPVWMSTGSQGQKGSGAI